MGFILSRLSVSMMGLSPRRLAPSQTARDRQRGGGGGSGHWAWGRRCNQSGLWLDGVIGI